MGQIHGQNLGSPAAIVTSAGELLITGSVQSTSTITTGSESFIFGKSGTAWLPLKVISGTEATLVTNISNFNDLGSNVTGSVAITTNPVPVSGIINQGTVPWIVLGSTRVVQDSTVRQISAGSVNVNNFSDLGSSRIITAGSVIITNTPTVTTGSESFLYAKSGTAWLPLTVKSGTAAILRVDVDNASTVGSLSTQDVSISAGSAEVYQTTAGDLNATVDVNNPATIGSYTTQKIIGSVAITTTVLPVSGTLFQDTLGSQAITNFSVLGSSRVIEEVTPLDSSQNNPAWKFEYVFSGTSTGVTGSRIGSIVQFIGAGSFVNVITYSNNRINTIGSTS